MAENLPEEPTRQALKQYYHDYDRKLATAFRTDCEEFLEIFEKLGSLKFSVFASIWREQYFTYVFAEQQYALCLKNFCEDVFYIVKKFIMFPKTIFTQVGALYMMYGLYYKQPLKQWIKIRLTLDENKKITELVEEVKNKGQPDAAYIFSKMKLEAAFVYVAQRRPLGPEDRFVKAFECYCNDTFASSKVNSIISQFNSISSSPILQNLYETNREYEDLLNKYAKNGSNLLPFTSTIVKDIEDACLSFNRGDNRIQRREHSDHNEDDDEDEELSIGAKRHHIREKAMANKNAVYRGSRKVKTAQDEDILNLSNHKMETSGSSSDNDV